MEQIFFLVLIAVVGLARWLLQAAENRKNTEAEKQSSASADSTPPGRAPAQSEEERVRRFFEALGVPTTGSPPPRVQPRQVTPRKPKAKPTIAPIDPFPMPRTGGLPPPLVAPAPNCHPRRASCSQESCHSSAARSFDRASGTRRGQVRSPRHRRSLARRIHLHVLTARNWRASGHGGGTARCHRPARDPGTATQHAALQPQRPLARATGRRFALRRCVRSRDQ